jgi:hypothetical protein
MGLTTRRKVRKTRKASLSVFPMRTRRRTRGARTRKARTRKRQVRRTKRLGGGTKSAGEITREITEYGNRPSAILKMKYKDIIDMSIEGCTPPQKAEHALVISGWQALTNQYEPTLDPDLPDGRHPKSMAGPSILHASPRGRVRPGLARARARARARVREARQTVADPPAGPPADSLSPADSRPPADPPAAPLSPFTTLFRKVQNRTVPQSEALGEAQQKRVEEEIHKHKQSMITPIWIPDSEHTTCMDHTCETEFSKSIRRHHCRACGQIVCGDHIHKEKVPLNQWVSSTGRHAVHQLPDKNTKQKQVCTRCYAEMERCRVCNSGR